MKRILMTLLFVALAVNGFAAMILLNSGESLDVQVLDRNYSATEIQVQDKDKVFTVKKADITRIYDDDFTADTSPAAPAESKQAAKNASVENTQLSIIQLKSGMVVRGIIIDKDYAPDKVQINENGRIYTLNKSDITVIDNKTLNYKPAEKPKKTASPEPKPAAADKKSPDPQPAPQPASSGGRAEMWSVSVSPLKEQLSVRLMPWECAGFELGVGTEIYPDNVYTAEDSLLYNGVPGEHLLASLSAVTQLYKNGSLNANLLPGVVYQYDRWSGQDAYSLLTRVINRVSVVCGVELEWRPEIFSGNFAVCSGAGLALQYRSSAHYYKDADGKEKEARAPNTSLVVLLASDIVINPVYLRYYF